MEFLSRKGPRFSAKLPGAGVKSHKTVTGESGL
jgi:hypothetical protein